MPRPIFVLLASLSFLLPLAAQRPMIPNPGVERILAVVPLDGAGTAADPRRPGFIPARGLPPGITAYTWQPSDDGRFAIVEFQARARAAFASILADRRPEIKIFEPHRHSRDEVETAIRVFKRDFNLARFRGLGQ